MRRKALIALACVLVFGAYLAWPAFHEPAHASQPCTQDDEGSWSYKIEAESGTAPRWAGTSGATASRASDEVEGTEHPVTALTLYWSAGCVVDFDAAPG